MRRRKHTMRRITGLCGTEVKDDSYADGIRYPRLNQC